MLKDETLKKTRILVLFYLSLKWGLSNGGLRRLSAICAQSSTIVHFCGHFGPLSEGNFRRKTTTIVGNRGQLWTSSLSPHLLSPHLDFPDIMSQITNRQSLVFSKRGQLSMWNRCFTNERQLRDPNRGTMNAGSMRTDFCVLEGDMTPNKR